MKKIKSYIIILLVISLATTTRFAQSQIVCADVEILPSNSEQVDFVFDSFSKYISGVTFYGVAKVNIKVDDQTPPNPNCKWMLSMTVENNPSGSTAVDKWETLANYSSGGAAPPDLEILDVRITNGCSTSPVDGVYQHFIQSGDFIEIIENTGIRIDAGSCTTNVNGPGNYLMNYDEFHFQIDFRIVPGFAFDPGIYQLQVKFELTEVP